MTEPRPHLVLLDCQEFQADTHGSSLNQAVVQRISELLAHGRHNGWKVVHCQTILDNATGSSAPIAQLRPHTREPLFQRRNLSAFDDSYFCQTIARADTAPIYLTGFSAPMSVLATVFDAVARASRISLIPDAIGSEPVNDRSPEETLAFSLDLMRPLVPFSSVSAIEA